MGLKYFELEIYNNILSSIAEEMGSVLIRAGFSPNIKERRDLSCAIFNSNSEMIAQAAHIPVHLGSMSFSTRAISGIKELNDGDIFILNDPFKGGTHLPDITCILPLFVDSKIEFLLATRAHHSDIGGKTPGSMPLSKSVNEEGVIIPPTKIISKGKLDKKTLDRIIYSTRNPREREGDFNAQIASLEIGRTRLTEVIDKYTIELIKEASGELLNYSEKLMKNVIMEIPDGKYEFIDFLDDDGAGKKNIPIKVEITISGDKALIDFTGSSNSVEGCLNCPASVTTSAVIYCFQCLAPKNTPLNSGPLRAIEIKLDEDSILNAKYPSAVVGGNVETSQRIVDVVFGALSKAIPEKIQAASCGSMNNITFGGINTKEEEYTYYETIGGGMGGRKGIKGVNAVQTHMTNTLNTPIEAIEREFPVRIESYKIKKNSGGKGRYNGGDGIIREYLFTRKSLVTLITERRNISPWGISGGGSGKKGRSILIEDNKKGTILKPKCSLEVDPGNVIRIETAGGGGWGE